MASEKDRERAAKQAEKDEAARFADWKAVQEAEGYTVEGDTMATARVVELPDGPTHSERPGS